MPDSQQCANGQRADTEVFWLFLQEFCARMRVRAAAGLVPVLLPQPGCCSLVQPALPWARLPRQAAPSDHQSMGMLHPSGQRGGILPRAAEYLGKLEGFLPSKC